MKKRDTLKSKLLFNDVIQHEKRISNKYFVICYQKKDFVKNNYGLAVGKKLGNAVKRNRIKRQLRNIIDRNVLSFPNFHNYIIICKKEVINLSFADMEKWLIKLLSEKGEKIWKIKY